jgi:hypothetical protein
MKRFIQAALFAVIILSAIVFQARVAAQETTPNYHFGQTSPVAGGAKKRLHLQSGAQIVQVTNAGEANSAAVSHLYGSSFNANSTRFIIDINGQPTQYRFNQIGMGFQQEGLIFDNAQGQASSWQWSAVDSDMLSGKVARCGWQPRHFGQLYFHYARGCIWSDFLCRTEWHRKREWYDIESMEFANRAQSASRCRRRRNHLHAWRHLQRQVPQQS